jgi:hypothetical protein
VFAWLRRLLASAPAPSRPAPPYEHLASRSVPELIRELDALDTIALGRVGVAALMSPGEAIARAIAARPDGVVAAEQLVATGGPAARLYGLWILGEHAPEVAARHAERLTADPAPVWQMSGCIKMPSTVADEARRLRR